MDTKVRRLSLYQSATWRLTTWYVLSMMVLSLLFSGVLYQVATNEFDRALGPGKLGAARIFISNETEFNILRQKRIDDSSTRLVTSLIVLNFVVLVGGTALSYLLARRTLHPIEAAHEAQARFASDAAHEMRTPLAVMQTEIEVGLRGKKATVADYETVLKSSLEEVMRLRTLTDRLLLLASQQELPATAVDSEMAASETMTRLISLAQAKSIAIDNRVEQVAVLGHYESVVDVLGILLENAIKYSPKKTTVVLSSIVKGGTVSISVADEGPGIAVHERDKVFERFYRSDVARSKENVEGHGLGLSLARRLAREMRGEVSLADNVPTGSIFTLTLPVAAVQ